MKLNLFLCFLVQTNAFRVPLPYGTGIASSGQDMGSQGIFDLIWTWFADPDDNSVQGNYVNEKNISKTLSSKKSFYSYSRGHC